VKTNKNDVKHIALTINLSASVSVYTKAGHDHESIYISHTVEK
jgi:hypothetical protein